MTPAEHPILMAGPLVGPTLRGEKTNTRRLPRFTRANLWVDGVGWTKGDPNVCDQIGPIYGSDRVWGWGMDGKIHATAKAPCAPGDTLWVQETWAEGDGDECETTLYYAASDGPWTGPWRPSIHMPRWAARLFLRVESVTVERVQDITEEDAQREGLPSNSGPLSALAGMFANKSIHEFSPGALADGLISLDTDGKADHATYRGAFACLWDSLAPAGSTWADNPWVWRVGFTRIEVSQ